MNIYLRCMSLLPIDMTQVDEILTQVRQELTYSTYSIWLDIADDDLATQWARASATMIFTIMNHIDRSPHIKG